MISPAKVTHAHLLKTAADKIGDPRGAGIAEGFVSHLYKVAAAVQHAPAGTASEVLAFKVAFALAISRKDKLTYANAKLAADDATATEILGKIAEAVVVERTAASVGDANAQEVQKLSQEYILDLAGALLA